MDKRRKTLRFLTLQEWRQKQLEKLLDESDLYY